MSMSDYELTCCKCGRDFCVDDEFPSGDDVECPHCGAWLTTEVEGYADSLWYWVTGERL